MRIEARDATVSDAIAICEIVRRSICECCVADHRRDPAALSAWLENKTPENASAWVQSLNSVAVVALRVDVVIGFALAKGDELALCYVVPEALHQGVGKALLRAIEFRLTSRGIRTLRLESTRTAEGFYSRNGFIASGPPQVWAGMEGFPMSKALMANPSAEPTCSSQP
ncbi:GNAT family N-acetyltransferase [Roseateles sp.]|uniref:GNAT family N-acetyltransferase n=1 Tax=Roseateles sp. TaxID=1971397 RepID=UPI003BA6112F